MQVMVPTLVLARLRREQELTSLPALAGTPLLPVCVDRGHMLKVQRREVCMWLGGFLLSGP